MLAAFYAATDEFHQSFVPSREGRVHDVVIDIGSAPMDRLLTSLRDVAATLAHTHPHLFANTAVFASHATVQAVQAAVAALERTLSLPAWAL